MATALLCCNTERAKTESTGIHSSKKTQIFIPFETELNIWVGLNSLSLSMTERGYSLSTLIEVSSIEDFVRNSSP